MIAEPGADVRRAARRTERIRVRGLHRIDLRLADALTHTPDTVGRPGDGGNRSEVGSYRVTMTTRSVPGFLPSTSGFRFANAFPNVPVRRIGIPGVISVPIGDASNGLCGGMAFAARDYFESGRTPPGLESPPSEGALFDYLVDRLFDSFDLPVGTRPLPGADAPAPPGRRDLLEPPRDRAARPRASHGAAGVAEGSRRHPRRSPLAPRPRPREIGRPVRAQAEPPGARLRLRPRRDRPDASPVRPEPPRRRRRHALARHRRSLGTAGDRDVLPPARRSSRSSASPTNRRHRRSPNGVRVA